MTGNGEEKVIVEGREVRQFVNKHLRDSFRAGAFPRDPVLGRLGKELIG